MTCHVMACHVMACHIYIYIYAPEAPKGGSGGAPVSPLVYRFSINFLTNVLISISNISGTDFGASFPPLSRAKGVQRNGFCSSWGGLIYLGAKMAPRPLQEGLGTAFG